MKIIPLDVKRRLTNYKDLDEACQKEISFILAPISTSSSCCPIFFKSKKENAYQNIKNEDDRAEIIEILSSISSFARHQRSYYYRAINFEDVDFQEKFLRLLNKLSEVQHSIVEEGSYNFEQQLRQFGVGFNHSILNNVKNEGINYFVEKEEKEQEAMRRSRQNPGMRWH